MRRRQKGAPERRKRAQQLGGSVGLEKDSPVGLLVGRDGFGILET